MNKVFIKGKFLGEGRNRIVYQYTAKLVLKIPKNNNGIHDNFHEAFISNKIGRKINTGHAAYARCKLLSNGYLLMEHVVPLKYSEIIELVKDKNFQWINYIDCDQVGYTVDNRIVAYDYGIT